MFFNKKDKNLKKCESCGEKIENKFSFCPYCGNTFTNTEKELKDFGLLGKNDSLENFNQPPQQNFGITDKLINSIFNSLIKNLDKQFQGQFKDLEKEFGKAEIKTFPNGIRIKIASPFEMPQKTPKKKATVKREISDEQIRKMSKLPRIKAKSVVKRLGDKLIYELSTPGVESVDDIFVSKIESGYEIKALGNKKIYVNSIPLNLPIKKYSVGNNKLLVEFNAMEDFED